MLAICYSCQELYQNYIVEGVREAQRGRATCLTARRRRAGRRQPTSSMNPSLDSLLPGGLQSACAVLLGDGACGEAVMTEDTGSP